LPAGPQPVSHGWTATPPGWLAGSFDDTAAGQGGQMRPGGVGVDPHGAGELPDGHRAVTGEHPQQAQAKRVGDCLEEIFRHSFVFIPQSAGKNQGMYAKRPDDGHEMQGPGGRGGWIALIKGLPGHPLHPPFTDLTIGMFVFAAVLSVIGYAGGIEEAAGKATWLALIGGLGAAVPAALTGFVDWVTIDWGSPRWRTATWHLTAMLTAVTLFALAAWQQWSGYRHGDVTTAGLVLTLAGASALLVGGWLGGAVVFVHGMRVESTEARGHSPGSGTALENRAEEIAR
jgi:uncharacterized membrane protein